MIKFRKFKVPMEKIPEQHDWQLVSRSYAPPVKQVSEQLTDVKLLERAMFGVTTLLFIDSITGELKKEEILGSDENQLFDMLDKSQKYGIQYIVHNSNKFAIALVPSEEAS